MIATYAGQKLGPELATLCLILIGLIAAAAIFSAILKFLDRQSEARSRSRNLYLMERAERGHK